MKRPALRWRRHEARKGLAAIGAPPRGWSIPDGQGNHAIASVYPKVEKFTVLGWYFVVSVNSGLSHFNSYTNDQIFTDADQAKQAAATYLKSGWAALEKK